MPLTQIMPVHHLLRAANTEVESNFLKNAIKVESNHCGYWLIWVSWSQRLNPMLNSVKDFCQVFLIPFPT